MARFDERLQLRISPQMAAALEQEANRRLVTQSAVVRIAIAKELGLYPPLHANETTVSDTAQAERQPAEVTA